MYIDKFGLQIFILGFCIDIYKGNGTINFLSGIILSGFVFKALWAPLNELFVFIFNLKRDLLHMSENIKANNFKIIYLEDFTLFP